MQFKLIDDELHYDGYLVGMLVSTGVPASVMGPLRDGLEDGTLFDEEDTDVPKCPECEVEPKHKKDCSHFEDKCGKTPRDLIEDYDCALDDVQRAAKEYARGGLLRLSDLAVICKQLLEEEQNETDAS